MTTGSGVRAGAAGDGEIEVAGRSAGRGGLQVLPCDLPPGKAESAGAVSGLRCHSGAHCSLGAITDTSAKEVRGDDDLITDPASRCPVVDHRCSCSRRRQADDFLALDVHAPVQGVRLMGRRGGTGESRERQRRCCHHAPLRNGLHSSSPDERGLFGCAQEFSLCDGASILKLIKGAWFIRPAASPRHHARTDCVQWPRARRSRPCHASGRSEEDGAAVHPAELLAVGDEFGADWTLAATGSGYVVKGPAVAVGKDAACSVTVRQLPDAEELPSRRCRPTATRPLDRTRRHPQRRSRLFGTGAEAQGGSARRRAGAPTPSLEDAKPLAAPSSAAPGPEAQKDGDDGLGAGGRAGTGAAAGDGLVVSVTPGLAAVSWGCQRDGACWAPRYAVRPHWPWPVHSSASSSRRARHTFRVIWRP